MTKNYFGLPAVYLIGSSWQTKNSPPHKTIFLYFSYLKRNFPTDDNKWISEIVPRISNFIDR